MTRVKNLLGHSYTVERGRRWLWSIVLLGFLMLGVLGVVVAGRVSVWCFVVAYVIWALACVAALLDFVIPALQEQANAPKLDYEDELGEPVQEIEDGQIWRDRTAPEELIRIARSRPGGGVLIERIAGVLPATHFKIFPVHATELRWRFELIPEEWGVPEPVAAEQVWEDREGKGQLLKILHVDDEAVQELGEEEARVVERTITVERTAGTHPLALGVPFNLSEAQLRAAFAPDHAEIEKVA